MSETDDQKLDLASVFPAKGDSRRPPDWWGRALLYTVIAVFAAIFVWTSWGKISTIVLDVVISIFIALAVEPLVVSMVRHGWKRGLASAVSLIGLAVIVMALLTLFGNMFVQQLISMVKGLPSIYTEIVDAVKQYTSFDMPKIENLRHGDIQERADVVDHRFRRSGVDHHDGRVQLPVESADRVDGDVLYFGRGPEDAPQPVPVARTEHAAPFLLGWTVVQEQISGFLFSRSILAAINATCTAVFLEIIHVPYWLPLALFCGIVSQFVPTVGTYIGGALPVLFAWGSNGLWYGVGVLVFIIVYQQIENLILSPKVSQRTMDLNPCVAFLAVLVMGALFGALGAFLALPVTASMQAIFKVYTKRYALVESPLMSDPVPGKKSKVVEGAEAFSERVIKPMSDHMPRAAKGSSAHVPISDELRVLRDQIYDLDEANETEDSETIAIPKDVLSRSVREGAKSGNAVKLRGVGDGTAQAHGDDGSSDGSAEPGAAKTSSDRPSDGESSGTAAKPAADRPAKTARPRRGDGSTDNPRSRWR